jgi:hypothetical protein
MPNHEFDTIDLLLSSDAPTRAVDAFALAVIKIERQFRKIFTNLVYQAECYGSEDIPKLRDALSSNTKIYFSQIEACFNALSAISTKEIIGKDYERLTTRLQEAIGYRNKIFHGQLTQKNLSASDLEQLIADLRLWSELLGNGAEQYFGYDGIKRNSFQKSALPDIHKVIKIKLTSIQDYVDLLKAHQR